MAMAVFIGIVVWAYSSHRKADFDKAGRIAMDDDKPANMNSSNKIEE